VKANLDNADLHNSVMREVRMFRASMDDANLRAVDLTNAQLKYIFACGAHFKQAILHGADLEHADLDGAYVHGADFRGALGLQTVLAKRLYTSQIPSDRPLEQTTAHTWLLQAGQGLVL
jgi:uncharacterized protein YjbI with pentapeptide repeats